MSKSKRLYTKLGFNEGASDSVKQAFLKHLTKAARELSHQNREVFEKQNSQNEQLAFDLEVLQAGNVLASDRKKAA